MIRHRVEFFTAGVQEGNIDELLLRIKNRVNQWLTEHDGKVGLGKMYLSVFEGYPMFWIWYKEIDEP